VYLHPFSRALIWSYGGSIQDEDENVVIDSPEVVEAVQFMARNQMNGKKRVVRDEMNTIVGIETVQ